MADEAKHNQAEYPLEIGPYFPPYCGRTIKMCSYNTQKLQWLVWLGQAKPNARKGDKSKGQKDAPTTNEPQSTLLIWTDAFPVIIQDQSSTIHGTPNHKILARTMP